MPEFSAFKMFLQYYIIISMKNSQENRKQLYFLENSSSPTFTESNLCLTQIRSNQKLCLNDSLKHEQKPGKIKKNIKYSNTNNVTISFSSELDPVVEKKTFKKTQISDKSKQYQKTISIKKSNNFRSYKQIGFKEKMRQYKIQSLVQHFISKLRRNSIYRIPIQYQPFHSQQYQTHSLQGLQIQKNILHIFFAISAAITVGMCLLSTFLMVFQEQIRQINFIRNFQILSLVWISIQIFLGFTRIREKGSKRMKTIKQISKTYVKFQFFIDLLFLFSILSQYGEFLQEQSKILLVFSFFKLPDALKKLKALQNRLLQFFYYEHYWGLSKMFLLNFFFAHVVAIALLMMADFDSTKNWILEKGLTNSFWFEKYYWAYYWATTTMLSVGYGDIVATNYKQAIVVTMIQSISCMTLGYNINCIGNLLVQLRLKQMEKQKHLKVLKQLYDREEIEQELEYKIQNHIKEAYKMEKKLNFDRYLQFVQKLPNNLRLQFLRQSNKNFIKKVQFLKNFTNKTILRLAQKLQARMVLPQQPILKQQMKQIVILEQGQVGLCPNFGNSKYGQIVINQFISMDRQQPNLVSLEFARSTFVIRNYQLKSVGYSITSSISFKDFLEIIKRNNVDFQQFFSFKDKQHKEEEFQLLKCNQCSVNHSKFNCPKLHFIPISQKVIFKYLKTVKQSKAKRKLFDRIKPQAEALKVFKVYNETIDFGYESADFIDSKDSLSMIDVKSFQPKDLCLIQSRGQKMNFLNPQSMPFIFHRQPRTKIYSRQIAENLKTELIQFLKKDNNSDFWNIEIDKAKDYHFYLIDYNPKTFDRAQLKRSNNSKAFNKKS